MAKKISSRKYALEILHFYEQGVMLACRLEADEPFPAIGKGDMPNPSTWNLYFFDGSKSEFVEPAYGTVLKVTGSERSLVQREPSSHSQHRIKLFTAPSENNHVALFADSERRIVQPTRKP